jgi:hypothetical protein
MFPLQRAATVEDMVGMVLLLKSKVGVYLIGSVIVTDGGRLSVLSASYRTSRGAHFFTQSALNGL